MEKATPENTKPGVWVVTSPEDRRWDPVSIMLCNKISWGGDGNPSNKLIFTSLWDDEDRIVGMFNIDIIDDIGLPASDFEWYEGMGNLSVVTGIELEDEIKKSTNMSIRDFLKGIFEYRY